MDTNEFIAVAGGVLIGVLIRVSNMACAWLARVLKVNPPDEIPPIDATS